MRVLGWAGLALVMLGAVSVTAMALTAGHGNVPPSKPLAVALHDAATAAPPAGVTAHFAIHQHLIPGSSSLLSSGPLAGATGTVWAAGNTVRVLRTHGIDLAGRPPQHLSLFERQRFDYVITLCDRVREVCPEFPGRAQQLHWSIADPAASGGTGQETYPAFERMAAELETRIGFLLATIGAAPVQASTQEV